MITNDGEHIARAYLVRVHKVDESGPMREFTHIEDIDELPNKMRKLSGNVYDLPGPSSCLREFVVAHLGHTTTEEAFADVRRAW